MSFIKKTWLARIGVGLNRFRMNNSTDVVLESNPISVTQQGDQLSADNMNNLETRIGNAFDEMAGNLAPIEISPASTNHAVGTQIVYNGILYKVTSAISTDDNLVVGTNIEPYPVSSALSDIMTQGTNEYGSYIKFANGVLICWGEVGSYDEGKTPNTLKVWTKDFPVQFISSPSVSLGAWNDFDDSYQPNHVSWRDSNNHRTINIIVRYEGSYWNSISYTAIGFWK